MFSALSDATVGLRVREKKEVYEGEVTELTPVESEDAPGGYGKVRFLLDSSVYCLLIFQGLHLNSFPSSKNFSLNPLR